MNYFKSIYLLVFMLSITSAFAKDKEKKYIYFQKINGKTEQKIKLPLKCRIYEVGKKKRVGTIESVKPEGLIFSYFNYDSTDVAKIMDADLTRKEKDKKIDSLYDASKVYKLLRQDQLEKIEILSGGASINRQLGMLISSIALLGSGFALMASTSNHVGEGIQKQDWICIGGMAASATSMVILTKKVYHFNKWTFYHESKK
ncbi:MAG: hypothetical protein ABJG68_08490 [Crocinitomicaceae bacterium]